MAEADSAVLYRYASFNNYVLSRTPVGRWGDPQDLKGAVVFLASRASDYVSGLALVVDGGMISK
jgi:NAD(P)-dependent dehydrogenase (short-subunit alcohol dehydrogenase family)